MQVVVSSSLGLGVAGCTRWLYSEWGSETTVTASELGMMDAWFVGIVGEGD